MSFFSRVITPGCVFADVGANFGYYTLLGARLVGSGGKVLAFEPQPAVAELLRESLSINSMANVEVIEAALSNQPGRATLHVPKGRQSRSG